MNPSYKELLQQREALDRQIQEARKAEISAAIQQARALVRDFDLTPEDVFGGARTRAASPARGAKVAAKYRDPATGKTWTGRGKPPDWIRDQDRSRFLIA